VRQKVVQRAGQLLNPLSASEMTYIVSGGALNSTHSLTPTFSLNCSTLCIVRFDTWLFNKWILYYII